MSRDQGRPKLLVRSPRLDQMRDPLASEWNRELEEEARANALTTHDEGDIDLAQLVDFSQLNEIFANYLEVVGLPVAIIDFNGRVLASSNWQRVCMEFHRVHPETLQRCLESDRTLSRQMQEGKGYAVYRCKNGLTDCASPIIIEGQHIANLFIGQFFLKAPDMSEFEARCSQYGFDRAEYCQALLEVPIVEEAKVPAILELLVGLAHQIARQSIAEHRLRAAYQSVERQVHERTLELAEKERKYRQLFENMAGGFALHEIVLDERGQPCDTHFLEVNPSFERLTGLSTPEVLGRSFRDVMPDLADDWMNLVSQIGVLGSFEVQSQIRGRWYSVHVFEPIKGQVAAIFNDIQAIKDSEKSLLVAKKAAEEANEAKSMFLANMSHEIRTPMNAILGLSHLALRSDALPPKQQDQIAKIHTAARGLLGLVNDILDFSKIEADKLLIERIPFDLDQVIQRLVNTVTISAEEKGLKLVWHASPDVPRHLVGDPLRLGQVLLNLLSNAIKFTEEGQVTVWVRAVEASDGHTRLRFAVSDTGIGLTGDQQQRLFQAFSQADGTTTRKYGGTGLGLAISQRLVSAMGGEIQVKSGPTAGSTFSFVLPFDVADDGGRGTTAFAPRRVDGDAIAGARVLVVEDNAINQQVVREMLEEAGVAVVVADHGRIALELLADDQSLFDAVLMDLQMPEMDGYEATRRIRDELGLTSLPIIAMTAHALESERQRCLATGMVDHLSKPLEPEQLVAVLARWVTPRADAPGPAARPADDGRLPLTLPGIGVAAALSRLSGNHASLLRHLRTFDEASRLQMNDLRAALEHNDRGEAQALAHNLLGVAALLSMDGVAAAARSLEQALASGGGDAELEALERALAVVRAGLATLPRAGGQSL